MKAHQERTRVRSGTNLERAHLLNQRVVLETVRLNEPVSRIEIARLTGLTNQTVFNIVEDLQQIGLIQNFGRKTAERGQPAKLFEIDDDFSLLQTRRSNRSTARSANYVGRTNAAGSGDLVLPYRVQSISVTARWLSRQISQVGNKSMFRTTIRKKRDCVSC